jgi:hypothetical protein
MNCRRVRAGQTAVISVSPLRGLATLLLVCSTSSHNRSADPNPVGRFRLTRGRFGITTPAHRRRASRRSFHAAVGLRNARVVRASRASSVDPGHRQNMENSRASLTVPDVRSSARTAHVGSMTLLGVVRPIQAPAVPAGRHRRRDRGVMTVSRVLCTGRSRSVRGRPIHGVVGRIC